MLIELDLNKNLDQNASVYYEAAKKAKKKLLATKESLSKMEIELSKVQEKEEFEKVKRQEKLAKRKLEWFEKLRWFYSSEDFLCIGGRDSTTNEIIIKKHTEKEDIVFHTEMAGSPFFVIKTEGKKVGEETINEVAIATASFSRAWRLGLGSAQVYHIAPEQVSKVPVSGTYLAKGAFMIYGKKEQMNPQIGLSIGVDEQNRVVCGPESAISKHCAISVKLFAGDMKASDAGKQILRRLNNPKGVDLDDIIRSLPSGGVKIEAEKKKR